MAYSEKSWQAAFRVAEENLKKRGKETKKAAKKIWGNNLQVGAMEYMAEQFTEGVLNGYNAALQTWEQRQAQAQQQEDAQVHQEDVEEQAEAQQEEAEASPSEEDDSEE